MAFKIPAELKAKWLSALRSGEYNQGTGLLQASNGGYCCLGVLQMVADGDIQRNDKGESAGLPTVGWYRAHGITGLAGEDRGFPFHSEDIATLDVFLSKKHPKWDPDMGGCVTVSGLNDDYKFTFAEIADLIEAQAETV
jgi:hypothetical protein